MGKPLICCSWYESKGVVIIPFGKSIVCSTNSMAIKSGRQYCCRRHTSYSHPHPYPHHHDHLIIAMIMAMAIALVTIIHVYIIHILLVYYMVVVIILIIRYYKHDENLSVVRHVVDPTLWITVLLCELRHDFFKWSNPKIHQTIPKWSTGLQTWSCSVVP